MTALVFCGLLFLLAGSVRTHPSIFAERTLAASSRRASHLQCSKYEVACTSLENFKCQIKDYACQEVLWSKCHWETMKMVVHKTVEKCDANGNCQENEIQETQERPMELCRVEKIPTSKCKAESPIIDCKRCTTVDMESSNEEDICDADDFDLNDVSASCLCKIVKDDPTIITREGLLYEITNLGEEREDLVRVILDAGANPEHTNHRFGMTPLERAAEKGYQAIIRLLLGGGANINASTLNAAPLYRAIRKFKTEAAVQLLRAGADYESLSSDGYNALMYAIAYKNDKVFRLVMSDDYGTDINVVSTRNNYTPLLLAALNSRASYARILLEAGAKIEVTDRVGNTVFNLVAKGLTQGRAPTLRILLDAAINAGRTDLLDLGGSHDSLNPLQNVARDAVAGRGDLQKEQAYMLIDAGASIDGLNQEGRDWLFRHAVTDKRYRLAKSLGSTLLNIGTILPNDEWQDSKTDNIVMKIPNAWNLIKLNDSVNRTQEETEYLNYVGDVGKVTSVTCQEFLNYWKNNRGDIAADSSLDDDEKTYLNEVLDEFDSSS